MTARGSTQDLLYANSDEFCARYVNPAAADDAILKLRKELGHNEYKAMDN